MSKLWIPSIYSGKYKLPPSVAQPLSVLLTPFKNRDAAFKLAVWLSRMNSSPKKLMATFKVVRWGIANNTDLDMTESKVRGALQTLRKIGFLEHVEPAHGHKHMKVYCAVRAKDVPWKIPYRYRFGFEFRRIFGYLVSRFSSPVGRAQDNRLLKDKKDKVRLTGEDVPPPNAIKPKGWKAPGAGSEPLPLFAFRKPVEAPKPPKACQPSGIVHDGLMSALSRLGSFIDRKSRFQTETAGQCPPC